MGAAEIGELLGVGRTRTKHYIARPDWPAPLDELAMGKVWSASDVEKWVREHRPDVAEDPQDD